MKARSWILPAALAVAILPVARAQAGGGQGETELARVTDRMDKAYRALRQQVSDPAKNDSSLALVATLQSAARAVAGLTPARAERLPPDERARFIADYRAHIGALQDALDHLETELTLGDNDGAASVMDYIDDLRRKGEQDFGSS